MVTHAELAELEVVDGSGAWSMTSCRYWSRSTSPTVCATIVDVVAEVAVPVGVNHVSTSGRAGVRV